MAYSGVPTVATGDPWSAANHNTYIRDNFAAGVPDIFTAAGELVYASGADAAAVLSKPANIGLLMNTSAGTPSYLAAAVADAYKYVRVNSAGNDFEMVAGSITVDAYNNSTGHSYSTAAWRDMPNSSKSVTVNVASTIVAFGGVVGYGTGTYGYRSFKFNIDGNDIDTHVTDEAYQINERVTHPVMGYKTGIAAGSRTVKLREYSAAGGAYTVEDLFYIVLIIPE